MARRFEETVNLQPVDTRTGAGAAALSLADQLEGFKNQTMQLARADAVSRGQATGTAAAGERRKAIESAEKELAESQIGFTKSRAAAARRAEAARKQGLRVFDPEAARLEKAEKGLAEANKAPTFKREGLFGGIAATSHNKALRGAYLASLSNDINESVTELEAENSDNILKFNDSANGLTKGILSGVDPASREQVATFLDGKVIAARGRVHTRNLAKDKAAATGTMTTFANNALDDANAAARAGDRLTSAEMLVEHNIVNAGMVDAGLMTQAEADIKSIEAEFSTTKEFLIGGIAAQTQAGKYNDAIESIQKFRDKIPKGFTIEQHDEVITGMISELNESLALNNKIEDATAATLNAEQSMSYTDLFAGVASGTSNAQDVIAATKGRTITAEQGSKLLNTINSRGMGADDWGLVTRIQASIDSGTVSNNIISNDIIENAGTNLTESTALSLLTMMRDATEERSKARAAGGKSIYQSDDYKQATSFLTSMMRVTGFAGALDTEAERRLGQAKRDLFEGVGRGDNPWIIVDELIPKDDFNKRPNPRYGNKSDLVDAQAKTDEAFLAKEIDEATYNFQTRNIQTLTEIQQTLTDYNKAKKDALENATKR